MNLLVKAVKYFLSRPSLIKDEHGRLVRNVQTARIPGWSIVLIALVLVGLVLVVYQLARRYEQGVY